jgi:hypothetical protein
MIYSHLSGRAEGCGKGNGSSTSFRISERRTSDYRTYTLPAIFTGISGKGKVYSAEIHARSADSVLELPCQQRHTGSHETGRNPSPPIHFLMQKDLRRDGIADEGGWPILSRSLRKGGSLSHFCRRHTKAPVVIRGSMLVLAAICETSLG